MNGWTACWQTSRDGRSPNGEGYDANDQCRADVRCVERRCHKGTIRFTPAKPLPAALVRKIVKVRLAELAVKPKKPAKSQSPQIDPAVDAYLKSLDHPAKKEIEAIRKIILGVNPAIREGIKWNSPSFRLEDWFATLNLHKGQVRFILHTGAKAKSLNKTDIADPKGLLQLLAKDRVMVTFEGEKDVKAKRTALAAVLKQWIRNA